MTRGGGRGRGSKKRAKKVSRIISMTPKDECNLKIFYKVIAIEMYIG